MIWTKCFCVNNVSISFVVEAFNGWPNDLLGANVDKTHESHWCWVFTILTWTTSCSMFSRHDKFSPLLTLFFFLSIAKSFGSLECQELKIKPISNSKYNSFLNSVDIYFYRRFISQYFILLDDVFKIFLSVGNGTKCTRQFRLFIDAGPDIFKFVVFVWRFFIFPCVLDTKL